MQQIAKQDQSLTYQNATIRNDAMGKYRRLIFALLSKLDEASVEIIEGDEHLIFGERSATLNGKIVVHDPSFYKDVVLNGSIGGAEAYIDGKWTSPELTNVIQVLARNQSQLDQIENKVQWFSRLKKSLT